MYKNCGALIRNIYMQENEVIGEIESLSGFNGPDVARMVLNDHVNVGFSLRALGEVDVKPNGLIEVMLPIKAITYDIVSNPSHARARVMEFLPESVDLSQDNITLITEASEEDLFWLQQDNINLTNIKQFEHNYVKDIVQENFNKSIRMMNFRF